VVSVSGGVDSAVIYALCHAAMKKKDSPIKKVLGVAQPICSTESVWKRALELIPAFDGEVIVIDQSDVHKELFDLIEKAVGIEGSHFSRGQLRSYQRTPTAYFTSQLLAQEGFGAIVMGTGNFDEDGYLCYFCKAGDGIVDVQLIADLHKSEVFTVGRELKVPESILSAPPTADLWAGQTDEDELGFTYDFVELYTQYLMLKEGEKASFQSKCSPAAWKYFQETGNKADSIHRRNRHKLSFPVNLNILPTLKDTLN